MLTLTFSKPAIMHKSIDSNKSIQVLNFLFDGNQDLLTKAKANYLLYFLDRLHLRNYGHFLTENQWEFNQNTLYSAHLNQLLQKFSQDSFSLKFKINNQKIFNKIELRSMEIIRENFIHLNLIQLVEILQKLPEYPRDLGLKKFLSPEDLLKEDSSHPAFNQSKELLDFSLWVFQKNAILSNL